MEEPFDLNKLKNLTKLNTLDLYDDKKYIIDFLKFEGLRKVFFYHQPSMVNINGLTKAEDINIRKYKAKDLSDFKSFDKLKKLILWDTNISSLNGIENSKELEHLELIGPKNLADIEAIQYLPRLKYLKILGANSLQDISILKSTKCLTKLVLVNNKFIKQLNTIIPNSSIKFLNITKLENLDFINDMNLLEIINFDKVEDNDLTKLLHHKTLKTASFINKKTYNFSEKQIRTHLENTTTNKDFAPGGLIAKQNIIK